MANQRQAQKKQMGEQQGGFFSKVAQMVQANQGNQGNGQYPEDEMPNVIQTGGGAGMGQGGIASPGAAANKGAAEMAASRMSGYYPGRNPMDQFGGF